MTLFLLWIAAFVLYLLFDWLAPFPNADHSPTRKGR